MLAKHHFLTIDPVDNLAPGASYTVTLSNQVASRYGVALDAPFDGSDSLTFMPLNSGPTEIMALRAPATGELSPLTGQPINLVPVIATLLGDNTQSQQEGDVFNELAYVPNFPDATPLRISRGSLDSIGAVPNYEALRTVIQVIASGNPKIADKLTQGSFEVLGVAPMGAAYLFVKDQSIDNVSALAGKSIAVMSYDEAQGKMAARVGMSPVMSDITNFSGRFNNDSVDICFAPVMAYSALELYKGMAPDGGIIDYTLGQLTMQIIARDDKFSPEFATWSRKYFADTVFEQAMRVIRNAEQEVDKKWWIRITDEDRLRYDEMMRDARIELTQQGVYSQDMMTLLRNIRCRMDAGRAECSDNREVANR